MKILRCAIVEDANVHRILLEKAIAKNGRLRLVCSFSSSAKALKKLNKISVDLIFLDMEMPQLNGLQFLEQLQSSAQIIITSEHARYALNAFEYQVTDYLLKPYGRVRFETAIQKSLDRAKFFESELPENTLVVKHNLQQVALNVNHILWVEALGDYVKIITPQRNLVILSTLTAFHKKLKKDFFLRIHKSYIVNLKMIERYNHQYIEIRDKKLPISRTKTLELDQLLNYFE